MFPGNIVIDTLPAVSIKQTGDKEWLVDVGRCITGWCKVTFEGLQPGQEVRLDYADYMEDEKSFKKDHDHDILVAAGNSEETFCNKFNHHAFRYICISGAEKIKNIEALQISGNYREASTFTCSDEGLNAVHDLIHYTIRCLSFSGYMVDCPHIERQGYGGDGNSSTMTFQTMYDVAPTYYNWLQAWHDVIEPDGSVPHVAPMYNCGGGPYWCSFVVKAPWRSYLNYGDEQFLARQYDDMKLWMTYVDRYSREGLLHRWPDTNTRSWFLGDWIAPQDIDVKDSASVLLISNCCVSDALASMSHTARVLGKPDEAQQFDQKRLRLNERIHAEFYHPEDSTYGTGVPTDMAYAMISGVVPTNLYEGVKEKLEKLSRGKYNSHIAVGLTGVPVFTSWAVLNDEVDLMTDILRQRDCPGYLYMIEKGGTATWEYWHGRRSYIHNCFNGIGTWFYQALAGIRPDADAPGYRHFTIRPQYAQLINHVRATKECPYGEIAVEWTKSGNDKELRIAVPIGTTATLTLPEGTQKYQINGKKKKAKSDTLLLESGRYTIICHN